MSKLIEICCFSLKDAIIAQNGGADRIELCASYHDGGTTASYGTLKMARNQLKIPIYAIIRPRSGDFVYDNFEWMAMKEDIIMCRELGIDGISTGLLNHDNMPDIDKLMELKEIHGNLKLTFHRAFDFIINKNEAIEQLIQLNFTAIMSSGGEPDALSGSNKISKMKEKVGNQIQIIAAGGIRSGNIASVYRNSNADVLHTALYDKKKSGNNLFGLDSYFNEKDVRKLCDSLKNSQPA